MCAKLKNASANAVIQDDSAFFHSHTGSDKLHHAPQTAWYVHKWKTKKKKEKLWFVKLWRLAFTTSSRVSRGAAKSHPSQLQVENKWGQFKSWAWTATEILKNFMRFFLYFRKHVNTVEFPFKLPVFNMSDKPVASYLFDRSSSKQERCSPQLKLNFDLINLLTILCTLQWAHISQGSQHLSSV